MNLSFGGSGWRFVSEDSVGLTPLSRLLHSPNKLSRELNKTFTKYSYEKFKKYMQDTQSNFSNASSSFLQGILLQNCLKTPQFTTSQ